MVRCRIFFLIISMKKRDKQDIDSVDRPALEITEEMISAGAAVLEIYFPDENFSVDGASRIVRRIFLEMASCQ